MTFLYSLLPIALYLVVLRCFDAFSLVKWRTMLAWLAWGVVSAELVLGIVVFAQQTGCRWSAPWVSPILEETLKVLPLLWLVWRRKIVFLAETQLLGQAIGGGFAIVENLLYLSAYPQMTVATALVRGMGTTLLHMGCTALVASLLLSLVMRFDAEKRHVGGLLLMPFLLLPSIGIHTLHNTTTMDATTFMVGMLVVFFLLFYAIAKVNERGIIRWLDVSLDDDVKLIAALREGRFAETKAGRYLVEMRSRFEPLVFFDICVYMQLYLELLVAAKGRVMLRDAGIEVTETEEQKADRKSQQTELITLSRRIPKLGHHLLRPLIHATDQDNWVLKNG